MELGLSDEQRPFRIQSRATAHAQDYIRKG
jgi:hypothetical protein